MTFLINLDEYVVDANLIFFKNDKEAQLYGVRVRMSKQTKNCFYVSLLSHLINPSTRKKTFKGVTKKKKCIDLYWRTEVVLN